MSGSASKSGATSEEVERLKEENKRLVAENEELKRRLASASKKEKRVNQGGAPGETSARPLVVDASNEESVLVEAIASLEIALGQARKELVVFESKTNEGQLDRLPPELWQQIIEHHVEERYLLAVASTCRFFRGIQKELSARAEGEGRKRLLTDLTKDTVLEKAPCFSPGWFEWVHGSFNKRVGLPLYGWGRRELYEIDFMRLAAFQGSIETMKLLRSQDPPCPWDEYTCAYAARGGHLEVLKWLRGQGCEWDSYTCAEAALGGHLEVLKWARSQGCEWDIYTCGYAAEGGHLAVLKWARSQGCKWDGWTCAAAASRGHLEVLKWARGEGCPWDELTCGEAAKGGHLEVLKWARSQGCDWDRGTCAYAAYGGHLEVLKWLRSQGCPWDKSECRSQAERKGHSHVVEWIDEQAEDSDNN